MPPEADPVIAASTVTTSHSEITGSPASDFKPSRTTAKAANAAITAP